MKQVIRIVIVLVLAGMISWLASSPINGVLFKYKHHDTNRLTEIYEHSTPYDLLFIGSSRTHRSIYPRLIDSICHLNSYNAGTEAGFIHDFKLTLDGYLVHHPAPRVLVLTLDLPTFIKRNGIYFYPQYFPYLDNPAVREDLTNNGYHIDLLRIFPFLMITDLDDLTKEEALQKLRGRDTLDIPPGDFEYKGFLSNSDKHIVSQEVEKVKKYMNIEPGSVRALHAIIDTCKARHIRLIFTYAPEYNFNLQKARTNNENVFALVYSCARENHIPYLRDDSLELCHNPALFANNGHLNKTGALVYSAVLAGELNKVLSTPEP